MLDENVETERVGPTSCRELAAYLLYMMVDLAGVVDCLAWV